MERTLLWKGELGREMKNRRDFGIVASASCEKQNAKSHLKGVGGEEVSQIMEHPLWETRKTIEELNSRVSKGSDAKGMCQDVGGCFTLILNFLTQNIMSREATDVMMDMLLFLITQLRIILLL